MTMWVSEKQTGRREMQYNAYISILCITNDP